MLELGGVRWVGNMRERLMKTDREGGRGNRRARETEEGNEGDMERAGEGHLEVMDA